MLTGPPGPGGVRRRQQVDASCQWSLLWWWQCGRHSVGGVGSGSASSDRAGLATRS